jgi:hypothetical protein
LGGWGVGAETEVGVRDGIESLITEDRRKERKNKYGIRREKETNRGKR